MIIASWNVRGLVRPKKRRMLKKLVRKGIIDLLFLQETKVSRPGPKNCSWEWVSSYGALGGLITVWKGDVFHMVDVSNPPRALFIKLITVADSFTWAVGNAYGPNEIAKRAGFLLGLSASIAGWNLPYCLGGILIWSVYLLRNEEGAASLTVWNASRNSSMTTNLLTRHLWEELSLGRIVKKELP